MKMRLHSRGALVLMAVCVLGSLSVHREQRSRHELPFPDLPELTTLRCDFHQHTVFSDGEVWPTVRVEEAWRNGLDAIAISDHVEYLPHHADIPTNFGRSFQLARAAGAALGIIVIQAAEITRGEPPGHLNALFLTNIPALNVKDFRVAVSNTFQQGAFLFWNHPGWKGHGADPDPEQVAHGLRVALESQAAGIGCSVEDHLARRPGVDS